MSQIVPITNPDELLKALENLLMIKKEMLPPSKQKDLEIDQITSFIEEIKTAKKSLNQRGLDHLFDIIFTEAPNSLNFD